MNKNYDKNCLDVFRIVATVQVFLGHLITHYKMDNPPVDAVYFVRGVPILFVLCGFLAAKALDKYSVLDWLKKRVVRILPGFWFCIIVNSIIILAVYHVKPSIMEGMVYMVTQFFGMNFYTGDWLREYGVGTPNGVLWTIPVQIQFFLVAPLFRKYLSKSTLRSALCLVGGLAILSIGCNVVTGVIPVILGKLLGVTVFPFLYFLVAGMVGWYHRDRIVPVLSKYKWGILTAYVIWKIMEIKLQFPHLLDGVLYNTLTTILMAAVIFAFGFGGSWRLKNDLTFGFYLYHMVLINLVVYYGFNTFDPVWNGLLSCALVVVGTIACAWASQRYVENPVSEFIENRMKK